MKGIISLMAAVSFVLFCSCRVPKDVSYFQGIDEMGMEERKMMDQTYNPRICTDDMLIINVTSPDRATVAPYNPPPYGYYRPGESEISLSTETQNLYTYLVDEQGCINFPVLGRVELAGLTINEANRKMEGLIREAAPNALVNIQIANFKVSIFGEVNESNTYSIKSTRVSILDLIAMAGNLTINADRKNLLLIRDNGGKKEYVRMDLTDPHIFASPYFYLQQNDMLYVEPNAAQKKNSRYSNRDSFILSLVSTIAATVSVMTSVVLTISNRKK